MFRYIYFYHTFLIDSRDLFFFHSYIESGISIYQN